jgi:hypothetical protein
MISLLDPLWLHKNRFAMSTEKRVGRRLSNLVLAVSAPVAAGTLVADIAAATSGLERQPFLVAGVHFDDGVHDTESRRNEALVVVRRLRVVRHDRHDH